MKGKSGQALVEFIIILPVFIFLIIATIDITKIFYNQNTLENKMEEVVLLYKNNKDEEEIIAFLDDDSTKFTKKDEGEYTHLYLVKETTIIAPGLSLFLKNPYEIKIERVITNE